MLPSVNCICDHSYLDRGRLYGDKSSPGVYIVPSWRTEEQPTEWSTFTNTLVGNESSYSTTGKSFVLHALTFCLVSCLVLYCIVVLCCAVFGIMCCCVVLLHILVNDEINLTPSFVWCQLWHENKPLISETKRICVATNPYTCSCIWSLHIAYLFFLTNRLLTRFLATRCSRITTKHTLLNSVKMLDYCNG